jgi:surface protein
VGALRPPHRSPPHFVLMRRGQYTLLTTNPVQFHVFRTTRFRMKPLEHLRAVTATHSQESQCLSRENGWRSMRAGVPFSRRSNRRWAGSTDVGRSLRAGAPTHIGTPFTPWLAQHGREATSSHVSETRRGERQAVNPVATRGGDVGRGAERAHGATRTLVRAHHRACLCGHHRRLEGREVVLLQISQVVARVVGLAVDGGAVTPGVGAVSVHIRPGQGASVSEWNASKVMDMSNMFWGASSFNRDISEWVTSQVTDMSKMFMGATRFNGDISQWNTINK